MRVDMNQARGKSAGETIKELSAHRGDRRTSPMRPNLPATADYHIIWQFARWATMTSNKRIMRTVIGGQGLAFLFRRVGMAYYL
jgi:hypothetical protein